MRRVSQKRLVEVDETGIVLPESRGDCYPACVASIFELPLGVVPGLGGDSQAVWDWLALNFPGVGMVHRSWAEPKEPSYHPGYWIATIISARFRHRDCGWCSPNREESDPPNFWRRDDCPRCKGTGESPGLHAVVMENALRVWDPHPDADWDAPLQIVGETYFVVTDPARLAARVMPTPLAAVAL